MSMSPYLSAALQGMTGPNPNQQPPAPLPSPMGMGGGLPMMQPQQMGAPHMLPTMGGGGNPGPQPSPAPQPMGAANPAAQPMGGLGAVGRLQHLFPGSQRTSWADSPLGRAMLGRQAGVGQSPYQFGGPIGGQIAGGVRSGTHGLLEMGRAILGGNGAQP